MPTRKLLSNRGSILLLTLGGKDSLTNMDHYETTICTMIGAAVWILILTFMVVSPAAHAAQVVYGPFDQLCPSPLKHDLFEGSTSAEVVYLQFFLDHDPATVVAATGPGSQTYATTYFGTLTKDAVKRFQEKYALDILFPLGLRAPTGYVGPATRAKMSTLCQ